MQRLEADAERGLDRCSGFNPRLSIRRRSIFPGVSAVRLANGNSSPNSSTKYGDGSLSGTDV
jgi:hypothetical protein